MHKKYSQRNLQSFMQSVNYRENNEHTITGCQLPTGTEKKRHENIAKCACARPHVIMSTK